MDECMKVERRAVAMCDVHANVTRDFNYSHLIVGGDNLHVHILQRTRQYRQGRRN